MDAWFHRPEFRRAAQRISSAGRKPRILADVIKSIAGGATPSRSDDSLYADSGIRFLRIQNVGEGEVILDDVKFITPEVNDGELARSQLGVDDVLITITGRVGTAAVVSPGVLPANINQHIARVRVDEEEVIPEFVAAWLNSPVGRAMSNRRVSGGTRIALDYAAIRAIPCVIPDRTDQSRLVTQLDAARKRRKRMLADADALLAGLDGFVLDQLGLTLPPADGRTIYSVHLHDARERFDPDFHSPMFRALRQKIEHGKNTPRAIGNLCGPIQSGFAAGGDDQTDDPTIGVPHIRPLNISNTAELHFEGTKMVPRSAVAPRDFLQQGEVLFNNTNSTAWVGKSVVFDADRECACSNHISRLRLIDNDDNPYFLAALLNALRGLGFFGLLATNFNNQAGINGNTLERVRLPWPDGKIQSKIATEVARRRVEARRLRGEADALWEKAKADFEAALLGPAPATMKGGK